jgi:sterol desaturase/sphingolipid hydroxylase (fatty acid hydroxylase superfamily)
MIRTQGKAPSKMLYHQKSFRLIINEEGISTMIGFHVLDLILILFFFGVFVIGILGTLFWIWMLIDCATQEPSEGNDKVIWILVIIFTHFIGALIYYFIRRPERKRLLGR